MRRPAVLLFLALLAAAAPSRGEGVESLWLDSAVGHRHGGTLTFSFQVPARRQERDLAAATVTVKIADADPTNFAPGTRGYRPDARGLVARFKAPRKTKPRLLRFVLRPEAGTFVVKLGGARVDPRSFPVVELSFGGHVFRWHAPPPTGSGGGGGVVVGGGYDGSTPGGGATPSLPAGPVAFTSLVRNAYTLSGGAGPAVLRSQGELSSYLAGISGSPGVGPVDFSKEMVVVVAGDPVGAGYAPWSVRVRTITSSAAGLSVWYDKPWGPILMSGQPGGQPWNQPPFSAWIHFVKAPLTSASVTFNATVYETQLPWY